MDPMYGILLLPACWLGGREVHMAVGSVVASEFLSSKKKILKLVFRGGKKQWSLVFKARAKMIRYTNPLTEIPMMPQIQVDRAKWEDPSLLFITSILPSLSQYLILFL